MIWFEEYQMCTYTIEWWEGSWQFLLLLFDRNDELLHEVGKFYHSDCVEAVIKWVADHESYFNQT